MIVKQLIEQLQQYDENAIIVVENHKGNLRGANITPLDVVQDKEAPPYLRQYSLARTEEDEKRVIKAIAFFHN